MKAPPGLLGGPIARGLAAQLFGLFSVLLIQVLQVPLFVGVVGAHAYGSYLILIAIPSSLTLADFGLLSAASTRLTILVTRGGTGEAHTLSRFTNSVVLSVTTAALAVVVCVVLVLGDALGLSSPEARWIVVLYSLYAVLAVHTSSFEGAMRAAGAYAGGWMRISAVRVADFALSAVFLLLSGSLVLAVVGLLVSRAVGMALLALRVRAVAPWFGWRPVLPRAEMAPGLLRPTLGSLAQPIANAGMNQGAVIVIGILFGPLAVAVFSTSRTMVGVVRQFTGVITNSALPSLTQRLSRGELLRARGILRRTALFAVGGALVGGTGLVIAGPWIVRLWTGGEVETSTGLLLALCTQVVIETIWVTLASWFLAQNRHLGYSVVYLASASVYLTAALLLSPPSLEVVCWIQAACSAIVLGWVLVTLVGEARREPSAAAF